MKEYERLFARLTGVVRGGGRAAALSAKVARPGGVPRRARAGRGAASGRGQGGLP